MNYLYLTFSLVIIISIILIIYVTIYNNFQSYLLKLKETEKGIDEDLRKKYDILVTIKEKTKSDIEIEDLKEKNLSSFEFHRNIIEIETKLLVENEEIRDEQNQLDEINIKIGSKIRYYNDTVTSFNKVLSKFPSNIVAKISKNKPKNYFDDKNLYDKNKKDFKL